MKLINQLIFIFKISYILDIEIRETRFVNGLHKGMFCKKAVIPKGTRFGPFPGKKSFPCDTKLIENSKKIWEVFTDGRLTHFIYSNLEQNERNLCNAIVSFEPVLSRNYWMVYVNCARFAQEQNMIVVQFQGEIFYEVCKDVGQVY